ncbi:hypothetical protein BD560DRAFT_466418 [Blakeslea trispora]|nr:hypothetical protein BD560DRAFT_466418 [Blakeslea trispora]
MIHQEWSSLIQRCLDWLPYGRPSPCPFLHFDQPFNRAHAIDCLQIYNRLKIPLPVEDPLSFLLDILCTKKKLRSLLLFSPWKAH